MACSPDVQLAGNRSIYQSRFARCYLHSTSIYLEAISCVVRLEEEKRLVKIV